MENTLFKNGGMLRILLNFYIWHHLLCILFHTAGYVSVKHPRTRRPRHQPRAWEYIGPSAGIECVRRVDSVKLRATVPGGGVWLRRHARRAVQRRARRWPLRERGYLRAPATYLPDNSLNDENLTGILIGYRVCIIISVRTRLLPVCRHSYRTHDTSSVHFASCFKTTTSEAGKFLNETDKFTVFRENEAVC